MEPFPAAQGAMQDPLWTGHLSTTGHTQTHLHSLSLGQFRHANSPHMHIIGMREETRGPGKNLSNLGENVQTPHRQWPQQGINFFPSSTLQQNIIRGYASLISQKLATWWVFLWLLQRKIPQSSSQPPLPKLLSSVRYFQMAAELFFFCLNASVWQLLKLQLKSSLPNWISYIVTSVPWNHANYLKFPWL